MHNLTRPHIFNDYPDSGDNLYLECKGDFIWNNNSTVNHDEGQQTESMRLTSDGHLGIGTDNPTAKLQIDYSGPINAGEVELLLIKNKGSLTHDHSVRIWNTGDSVNNTYISIEDAYDDMVRDTVRIGTGDSFFDGHNDGGKVGIGTDVPVEKLHLEGGNFMMSRGQSIARAYTDVESTRTHYRSFEHSITRLADRNFRESSGHPASLGETHKIIFGYVDNYVQYSIPNNDLKLHPTNNAIKFHMINGSSSTAGIPDEPTHAPQMIITGDYKVGINHPNPESTLDVNGDAIIRTDLIVVQDFGVGGTGRFTGNVGIGTASNANNELHIKKNLNYTISPTNHIRDMLHLEATYDVDFGNPVRSHREGGASILFTVTNTGASAPGEAARIVAGCDELSYNQETNSYLAFHTSNENTGTGTVERMCIDYRGFVGINTKTPTKELEVNGDALIGNNLLVPQGFTDLSYAFIQNGLGVFGTTGIEANMYTRENMFIGSGIYTTAFARLNIRAGPFYNNFQNMLKFDISGNPWMFRSSRKVPTDDYSTDLRLTCGGQENWFMIDFDEGFDNLEIPSNNDQDNTPIFGVKVSKDINEQIVYVKSKLSIGSNTLSLDSFVFEAQGDGRFVGNLMLGDDANNSFLMINKASFPGRTTKDYFIGTTNNTTTFGGIGTEWSGFYIQDSSQKYLLTIDDIDGRVGINNDIETAFIKETLDISGNLLVRTKGAVGGIYFKKDNVSGSSEQFLSFDYRYSQNAEYAGIEVNDDSRMRIEAHGGIEFYTGGADVEVSSGVNGHDYHVFLNSLGQMNFWNSAYFFGNIHLEYGTTIYAQVDTTRYGNVGPETNYEKGPGKVKSDLFEGTFKDNDVKGPFMPIGTIIMWPGGSQPDAGKRGIWLPCNGFEFNYSDFPTLGEILGYSSGVCKTPDMNDRYPRSNDMPQGNSPCTIYQEANSRGGSETIGVNNLPSHNHNFTGTAHNHTASSADAGVHTHYIDSGTTSNSANHSHEVPGFNQGLPNHIHGIARVWFGGDESIGVIRGSHDTISDHQAIGRAGEILRSLNETNEEPANIGRSEFNSKAANANHSHECKFHTQQAGSHNHTITVDNTTAGGNIGNTGGGQVFKPKFTQVNFLIYGGFEHGQ